MPKQLSIHLTPKQQAKLEKMRDTDKRPYMRERATAILKVAAGMSGRQVALTGLLKQRSLNSV
jgi:hypothetical protein